MPARRSIGLLAATVLTAVSAVVVLPATDASAATCAAPYAAGTVYTGGQSASYNGDNWLAKWWTQGETPSTGGSGVWTDQGACGGTGGGGTGGGGTTSGSFPLSEAQFDQIFPNRNSFYTYQGLLDAVAAFPAFATTGSADTQKQEAAAFLANVSHETGQLVYVVEQNTANYPTYCASEPYGCPAGQAAYYGRGPLQLSWNFNYKAAGDYLGIDLLDNPNLVQTDSATSWKTALWYWNTQSGPGTMTPHNAIVNGAGFGETIRSINGSIECNGQNTAEMQDRVNYYQQYTSLLGTGTGPGSLTC